MMKKFADLATELTKKPILTWNSRQEKEKGKEKSAYLQLISS